MVGATVFSATDAVSQEAVVSLSQYIAVARARDAVVTHCLCTSARSIRSPPLADDVVVSEGPGTLETDPP